MLHIDRFLNVDNIGLYANEYILKAEVTKLCRRIAANTIFVEADVHV